MKANPSPIAVGIRCTDHSVTRIVLLGGPRFSLVDNQVDNLGQSQGQVIQKLASCASTMQQHLEDLGTPIVGLATCTPGTRLRKTSILRMHIEGACLLGAEMASVGAVTIAHSSIVRRVIPLARLGRKQAMDSICQRMGLTSGRKGDVTRSVYVLDAFTAAAVALAAQGEKLPSWLVEPGFEESDRTQEPASDVPF